MGVAGLEKLIRAGHSGISHKIDIRREIEQWRRDHGNNPTIIVDTKELMKMYFGIDEGGLILGGRYQKFNEILEYSFREMKKAGADLVFIVRLDEGKLRDIDKFRSTYSAYDCVMKRKSLNNFLSRTMGLHLTLRPNERVFYNLMHSICPKYGKQYNFYGLGKTPLVAYARANRENVMAMITRNTEFLVHEGDFQYWSLSDVDFCELSIATFCRRKLHEMLNLNVQQTQLLLVISRFEPKVKDQLTGGQGNLDRIPRLIDYVKKQKCGPNGYDSNELTGALTDDQRNEIEGKLASVMLINNYGGNWNEDIYDGVISHLVNNDETFNLVLQFCRENLYFAYKLMNETITIQKDLLFIDIRRPDAIPFIDLIISVTMKLCGIIFKDVEPDIQPKTRTVKIQRIFEEEAVQSEVDIDYPTMALPSLKDLIIEEDDKSVLTTTRWSLLEWLLNVGEESMSRINSSKKPLRIVLLTLKFLLTHEMISPHEADILLLTELDGRSKGNVYMPRNFCPPPPMPDTHYPSFVDISWVQIAHKYTIAYELICHCLELCGLRKETDIIEMDAFKFHENMNLFANGNDTAKKERMMAQIKEIRLW